MTGSDLMDAQRAFDREARRRRLRAAGQRLRGGAPARLPVLCERATGAAHGRIEIPLSAIRGTIEPVRAKQFDAAFRPRGDARRRWERVWLAERRGTPLPPISVVAVEGGYAVVDGHHRVSVARARGAVAIDAVVV